MTNAIYPIEPNSDTLDSRDIQERIDFLESMEDELDEDDKQELDMLRNFKSEVYDDSEWEDGILFINDRYFEDYAKELAEDVGAIGRDTQWPATHINWEDAADELRVDYTDIELDGHTYLYR